MKKCVCVCSFVGLGQQRSILVGSRMGYVMNECFEVMGVVLGCVVNIRHMGVHPQLVLMREHHS